MFSTERGSGRSEARLGVAQVHWVLSTFFTWGHLACVYVYVYIYINTIYKYYIYIFSNTKPSKRRLASFEGGKGMNDIHTNMDKFQDNYAKWQKPDQKERVSAVWPHFYKMLGNGNLWWQQAILGDGDKGREGLTTGTGNFWSWCRQSWSRLYWWFHRCIHMPELIKLYALNVKNNEIYIPCEEKYICLSPRDKPLLWTSSSRFFHFLFS